LIVDNPFGVGAFWARLSLLALGFGSHP
jgi:hypothetical protein